MKIRNNQLLGSYGEEKACSYLSSLGYKILHKNFRKNYVEIDIIALDGETLVVVEVKTRKGNSFGRAEESITRSKYQSLEKAALLYQNLHPKMFQSIRIDFVSLNIDSNGYEDIKLFKNISL